jgi:hypothetical protein
VLDALERVGDKTLPVVDSESRLRLQQHLDTLNTHVHQSSANMLVKDL